MPRKLSKNQDTSPTVSVPAVAKAGIVDWIEAHPHKPQQGLIIGSILRWFVKQNPPLQQMVINGIPDGMQKAYADELRRFASAIEHGEAEPNDPQTAPISESQRESRKP